MEDAIEQLQARDPKERLAGVEKLQTLLDQNRRSLSANEVQNLVDASISALRDSNFKVCQGTLHALASAAAVSGEHLKVHFNQLVPAVVERLGDSKQTVRDAGRRLLLAFMEISSPNTIVERAGISNSMGHKNWRVREEFARTVASAINLFAASNLPLQRLLLPIVLQVLEDSNSSVREAAMLCLEEMYWQGGQQFKEELQRHPLRPTQLKDIAARFDRIEPVKRSINDVLTGASSHQGQLNHPTNSYHVQSMQHYPANHGQATPIQYAFLRPKTTHAMTAHKQRSPQRRCSPKSKPTVAADISAGGEAEGIERPVDPIRVHSEKELTKEMEKVASLLTAEQDWSVRLAAMKKLEGLIVGGATEYSCFLALFKQLVGPLSVQLSDRRSSIVKQACQLLNLLSKELRANFEFFAESFIPVLFKLVVISVLVIAESADNCIKTMLRNCRVARVLPRVVELAKHDRNAILRTRCCEYALLVLEKWADSVELQRAPELYEDLIRCCSGDAMGEVRWTARMCYRVFARIWPDRARRLLSILDFGIQKLINEEDGSGRKRYSSPAVRDRVCYQQQQLRHSVGIPVLAGQGLSGDGPSGILHGHLSNGIGHERSKSLMPGARMTNSMSLVERQSMDMPPERNRLHKMLQASQHQVEAMEIMLREVDSEEKGTIFATERTDERDSVGGSYRKIHASASAGTARVGVDPPSARDPPHPASAPASSQGSGQPSSVVSAAIVPGYFCSKVVSPMALQGNGGPDAGKAGNQDVVGRITGGAATANPYMGFPCAGSHVSKRFPANIERPSHSGFKGDIDAKGTQIAKPEAQMGKKVAEISFIGVPGFQRSILRHPGSGRSSGSNSSMEDSHCLLGSTLHGESLNHMDGFISLNDALTEGLNPHADWSARVAAFTYLGRQPQQGSRRIQDVMQSFEKVMKLFSEHLDDPHYQVAQAALSTLIEMVPVCRKSFEPYLERILPSVFARLVDTKDSIRQLGSAALETIGKTYNIDALLPPLLRSLDEQRTPKARMAVIDFANAALAKLTLNGDGAGSTGILKLWLGKLAPLATDKNSKLKETAIAGIIAVYSHFDSVTVLNFILGLSIEEQSLLRRALKQFTPRIDLDLLAYLQRKCQRPRAKFGSNQADAVIATAEENGEATGMALSSLSNSSQEISGHTPLSSLDGGGRKWVANQSESKVHGHRFGQQQPNPNVGRKYLSPPRETSVYSKSKDMPNGVCVSPDRPALWLDQIGPHTLNGKYGVVRAQGMADVGEWPGTGSKIDAKRSSDPPADVQIGFSDSHLQAKMDHKFLPPEQPASNGPNLLHQMSSWGNEKLADEKQEALQKLAELSQSCAWSQSEREPGALKASKAIASNHLTKKILLAALKQSPSNLVPALQSYLRSTYGRQSKPRCRLCQVEVDKALILPLVCTT